MDVQCPSCGGTARVEKPADGPATVACADCGLRLTQELDQRLRYGMQRIYAEGPVDPYFGLRRVDAGDSGKDGGAGVN